MPRKFNPFSDPPKRKELPPHNKDLYEYLQAGNTVNFVTARSALGKRSWINAYRRSGSLQPFMESLLG